MEANTALNAAHILTTLVEGKYNIKGIAYQFISCSSHVISHTFRGIALAYDRNEMEQLSKGGRKGLSTFAYYNNQCFLLILNN